MLRSAIGGLSRTARSALVTGRFARIHVGGYGSGFLMHALPRTTFSALRFSLFFAAVVLVPAEGVAGGPPQFKRHLIASFPAGYQVAVADVNGDGRPDVIGLSTDANRVDWFENPDWTPHPVARTELNIDLAPRKLSPNRQLGIAIASGFYFGDGNRGGDIQWFEQPAESNALWRPSPIAVSPVDHRLRWGDLDGDGQPELVSAPIFGPGSHGPARATPSRLWAFRPPKDLAKAWKPWPIDESLTVLHGLRISDLDADGRDEILTASFEGIYRFDFEGNGEDAHWVKTQVGQGAAPVSPAAGAARGSSEVAPGKIGAGKRFMAAIEPWHGNQVVIYHEPDHPGLWERRVIDDSLSEGHALLVEDFDGDGRDEVIAGWRGGKGGVALYSAGEGAGEDWKRIQIDSDITVQGMVANDINGDGRLDFVAIAGRSNVIVWYEQQ